MFPQLKRGALLYMAPVVRAQVPPGIVYHMALTGEPLSARRAYELGIISKIMADDELMPEARKIAATIAGMGPRATAKTIKVLSAYYEVNHAAKDYEEDAFWELHWGSEIVEGMRAFRDHRDPEWTS